ncbi:hypothetical protein [Nitrosopumilus sp. S6]
MVLLWIGLGIGILIATYLIVKVLKTHSHDVLGIKKHCNKCGKETTGMNCPNCDDQFKSFGV